MYYKMSIDTDLSATSYRCCQYHDNEAYIQYNEGFLDPQWEEVSEDLIKSLFPDWFEEATIVESPMTVLTQFDRIEAQLDYISLQLEDLF